MVGVLFECAEVKLQLLASTKPRVAFVERLHSVHKEA